MQTAFFHVDILQSSRLRLPVVTIADWKTNIDSNSKQHNNDGIHVVCHQLKFRLTACWMFQNFVNTNNSNIWHLMHDSIAP